MRKLRKSLGISLGVSFLRAAISDADDGTGDFVDTVFPAGHWRTDVGEIDNFDDRGRITVRLDLDCFHGCSLDGRDPFAHHPAPRNGEYMAFMKSQFLPKQ
jgi:hypothetical protein